MQQDLAQRLNREARDILIGELLFGAIVLIGTIVTIVPLVAQLLHAPMLLVETTISLAAQQPPRL